MYRKLFLVAFVVLSVLIQGGAALGAGGSLLGRWMCDEGQGNTVSDSSGNKRHGRFVNGAAAWTTGHAGSAVQLVAPTLVEIPNINMTLSEATMAGWVFADGPQPNWAAMIMHRGSGSAHGFNLTADDGRPALAYHWNDDSATWGARTQAVYPLNEWTHCALTIQPTKATFYINGAEAHVVTVRHNPANWNQPFHLGGDGGSGYVDRRMKGALDDVVFFSRALDAQQVAGLMAGTLPVFLKAEKPTPADGATGINMPVTWLQWTPGEKSIYEDVYLGTTPELTAENRVVQQPAAMKMYIQVTPPLEPGQTYYWRVDSLDITKNLLATGDVWRFTVLALKASFPSPADGATGEFPGLVLTWMKGRDAASHRVYFGSDAAAVAGGAADADKGPADEPSFNTGALRASTTYYWRVDTINLDETVLQGDVWSFSTVDAGPAGKITREWWSGIGGTAINLLTGDAAYPKSPTGREYVDQFAGPVDWADNYGQRLYGWLKPPQTGDYTFWVSGDDDQQLWLSTDENPSNGVMIASVSGYTGAQEWEKFASQKSAPVSLNAGQKYFIMALGKDGGGGDSTAVAWQGGPIAAREVIKAEYVDAFALLPLVAFGPIPTNGAVDTIQTLTLTWNAGDRAQQHAVYLGDDANAVAAADASSPLFKGEQATASFDTGALEWGKTYYWRVDEISAGEAGSPWKGRVWSFTTASYLPVDDFESYTNDSPNRVFQTWIDGWGFSEDEFFPTGNPGNSTGSTVGHDIWTAGSPHFGQTIVETSIVAPGGSKQSMPFEYSNVDNPFYSETERTFASPQNWTLNGMDTLSLQVRGYSDVNNVAVTETGGKMSLTGAGADIWGASDEFTFAYKTLNGDGSLIAKVVSTGTGSSRWAKGGAMIRDSLEGRSASAQMVLTGGDGNGGAFQNRATAGLDMQANDATSNITMTNAIAPPYWVKIDRRGDTITGYISSDGAAWAAINSVDIVMTAPVYIGLCVTSHAANEDRTFQFENISTTGGVTGAWQGAVIDSPRNNGPQNLYVALQDSNNKTAVVTDATAVNSATWVEVRMPLSRFTGISVNKIKKMFIGVGDRNATSADGTGMLFIDDIRVIKPASAGQ